MHVTQKTEYALLALYTIWATGKGNPVSRTEIARMQGMSTAFLEKVLLSLQKVNLVKSVRGPGGGFVLASEPNAISMWDVYSAVDRAEVEPHRCHPKTPEPCQHWNGCKVKTIWRTFNDTIKDSMSKITLADIAKGDA